MQIYISYDRTDSEIAKKLYSDLKDQGLKPWLDEYDIRPGQNWKYEVQKAIEDSSYFVVLLSTNSVNKKGFVQKELKIALDLLENYAPSDVFIIPVRIEDISPSDENLNYLQWVDLFPSYDAGLNKLLEAIIPDRQQRSLDEQSHILHPKCFAVTSSKGGTGKSIITASIGYILSHCGFKTLLIDLDLFTHGLSFYLLAESPSKPQTSLSDIFLDKSDNEEVLPVHLTNKFLNDNLYLLPIIDRKRQVKAELSISPQFNNLDSFEAKVNQLLPLDEYDYIIIDTRGGDRPHEYWGCACRWSLHFSYRGRQAFMGYGRIVLQYD